MLLAAESLNVVAKTDFSTDHRSDLSIAAGVSTNAEFAPRDQSEALKKDAQYYAEDFGVNIDANMAR